MIEVHKVFNLFEVINHFISDRRAKQRLPPTSVTSRKTNCHMISRIKLHPGPYHVYFLISTYTLYFQQSIADYKWEALSGNR